MLRYHSQLVRKRVVIKFILHKNNKKIKKKTVVKTLLDTRDN